MSPDGGVLSPLVVTLRVAVTATILVAAPGVGLGYLLARRDFRGKSALASVLTLPLVLPPTAVGFLLLSLLAADGPLGRAALGFDLDILLTWKAAVLAEAALAIPLVVRTSRVAFEAVDPRLEGLARTLGHGPWRVFARFTLPMASKGVAAALILGFTRAVGEFGATMVLAGNIPGRTRTLASAIWSAQQSGRDREGLLLVGVALSLGFVAVLATEMLARSHDGIGARR